MPLSAGDKLGPYEINSLIGKGGMGEVYSAHDPRTGRDVAIKVSAERFNERFDREVRAVAALNHPNICTLFDVGPNYLVMELVLGEPPKGPLPLDTALNYARQIADALEAAHDKGITHRDLKPGNIKIKEDGTVKVLDFGLAKVTPTSAGESLAEDSPTLSMAATQMGVILGTAGYMSPEQARGKRVDKRADIWAFGVVLYEMLTGQRLFQGEDVSHTMAAVIMQEPDLEPVPPKVRRLLRRCLEKDPKKRLRDIGEARFLMDEKEPAAQGGTQARPLPWMVATAVLAVIVLALGFLYFQRPGEESRVVKFSIVPPEKSNFLPEIPAVSPDGRSVALVMSNGGQPLLWTRDLDSLAARPLPGTEGAGAPFWSPDGRSLAFFAGGRLKRVDVAGGPVQDLSEATALVSGGAWSQNNVIVFGRGLGGLFRVSAAGGTPTPATTPEPGELAHISPWFLPDGHHFLYSTRGASPDKEAVFVGELDSKSRHQVVAGSSNAVYVPSLSAKQGYIFFMRDRTLMSQPFDPAKAQTAGDAVPAAESVGRVGNSRSGQFSTSQNGVLVYASSGSTGGLQLTWIDRLGKVTGTVGGPGNIVWPGISPDGGTVAFDRQDPQTGSTDIWLYDLKRNRESRFTFGPQPSQFPVWSPDGSHLAFTASRDGGFYLSQKATSGPARQEPLDEDRSRIKRPQDWSRDNRYILESSPSGNGVGNSVWVLDLSGDHKASAYLRNEFNQGFPKLSPNGQWLAYSSNEYKRTEIFVQTFPKPGGKWQISSNGGRFPVWSRDGKELFFVGGDGKMTAVDMKDGPEKPGTPKALFDVHPGTDWLYDVAKDGKFLIPIPVADSGGGVVNVVINWQAALKK